MPLGKVVLRRQEILGYDVTTEVIETGGCVFPNGRCIDLVRCKTGELMLLRSPRRRPVESLEFGGQTFVTPTIDPSMSEALMLPPRRASYGSAEDLFKSIHDLFFHNGISDDNAKLLTYFTISSWFPELLPIAPCILITGSQPEAHLALTLLGTAVRHGLPLTDLSLRELRALPTHLQLTLLIGRLHPSMHKALATYAYPGAYLPSSEGLMDVSCAKVIYAGPRVAQSLPDEPVLRINLSPRREKLPTIHTATRQEMAARFQSRLLDYRFAHARQVHGSNFDIPSLSPNLRILAQALGACVADSPDLQAGIAPLLKGQHEQLRSNRAFDPECVTIEALLTHCHRDQGSSRIGVGEIGSTVNALLADRGETTEIEPRAIGNLLRALSFIPKRDNGGFALHLTDDLRLQIHARARDYQIDMDEPAGMSCAHCAEITVAAAPGNDARA